MFASRSTTPMTAEPPRATEITGLVVVVSTRARRVVASSSDLPKLYIPAVRWAGRVQNSRRPRPSVVYSRLSPFASMRTHRGRGERCGEASRAREPKRDRPKRQTDGGALWRLSLAQTADSPRSHRSRWELHVPDYDDLRRAMEEIPLGDGDSWIDEFTRINRRRSNYHCSARLHE